MEFDQSFVWITTRRLKPGAREEFSSIAEVVGTEQS